MAKSSSERVVPLIVRRAIFEGDSELLSQLGKIGARKSAQSRRAKKAAKEQAEKERLEDAEFWKEFNQSEKMADAAKQEMKPEVRVGWDDEYKP